MTTKRTKKSTPAQKPAAEVAPAATGDPKPRPALGPNLRSSDSRAVHPDKYSAPAGPAAEDEVADLLWGLTRLLHPDFVLETGTAWGHTALRIGQALRLNGHGRLYTLEITRQRFVQAQARLAKVPVTQALEDWRTWKPPEDAQFALCFFDATRTARDEEFKRFAPWMTDNAIVVFHDCGEQHPAKPLVDSLEAEGLIKSLFIPTPRGVCVAQRIV